MRSVVRHSKGFALLDTMLAVAVAGLVVSAALPMIIAGEDEIAARSLADDQSSFQQLAAQHFIANRSAYEAAMLDGTGADSLCRVNVNPVDGSGGIQANSLSMHTCALDVTMLAHLQALPRDMRLTNRFGERWVAIFRQLPDRQSLSQPGGAVDMLVVSSGSGPGAPNPVAPDERRYREITSAAAISGGTGGYVPDADRATCVSSRAQAKYEVCGNGWKVNLGDFVDAAMVDLFAARLAK
jgi:hypothetical protein